MVAREVVLAEETDVWYSSGWKWNNGNWLDLYINKKDMLSTSSEARQRVQATWKHSRVRNGAWNLWKPSAPGAEAGKVIQVYSRQIPKPLSHRETQVDRNTRAMWARSCFQAADIMLVSGHYNTDGTWEQYGLIDVGSVSMMKVMNPADKMGAYRFEEWADAYWYFMHIALELDVFRTGDIWPFGFKCAPGVIVGQRERRWAL